MNDSKYIIISALPRVLTHDITTFEIIIIISKIIIIKIINL